MRTSRCLGACALTLALLASPQRAHADLTNGWYGWEIMATDLGSLALAGIGAQGDGNKTLLAAGGLGVMLAPPVVHLAHGEYKSAGISLAVRALPMAWLIAVVGDESTPIQAALLPCGAFLLGVIYDWTFNAFAEKSDPMAVPRYSLSFTF